MRVPVRHFHQNCQKKRGADVSSKKNRNKQKEDYKEYRRQQEEKQKRLNRRLMWITGAVVVAIVALAIIFRPQPSPVEFAYDQLPVLGDPNAPVKIVEFGDYKCPACKAFSEQIKPQLVQDYIDKGLVSFYFMNLAFIGKDSFTAAYAAQSVFHQNNDAFWKYYDALFKNQGNEYIEWATPDFLVDLAKKEGLEIDFNKLQSDIESSTYASEVDEHIAKARSSGVSSTPTVFVNGVKIDNPFDYNALKAEIDKALNAEA
jgi:protein-disulfide isomerase